MFVFTGDFKDPFHEFFVDKLYRKGTSEISGSTDFIFKMTSEPEIKIPAFLVEIAGIIFKAGCSVNLLKKQ
jgi:hypothetical protein